MVYFIKGFIMQKITKLLGIIFCTAICTHAWGMMKMTKEDLDGYLSMMFNSEKFERKDSIRSSFMRDNINNLKIPETPEETTMLKKNLQTIARRYFSKCPAQKSINSIGDIRYLSIMARRIENQLGEKGLLPQFYSLLQPIINQEFVRQLDKLIKIKNQYSKNFSQTRSGVPYGMQH